MMTITWSADWELGIPVIDAQHKRIVDFINQLSKQGNNLQAIENVLIELKDYTSSHFAFEESMMEEAGYQFVKAHSKVHVLFIKRIDEYWEQHKKGNDIAGELVKTLKSWLFSHIKHDDQDYSTVVKSNMIEATERAKIKEKNKSWFKKLFS